MSGGSNPAALFRYGLAVAQSVVALFGAGTVLYQAHTLFLRYYQREWAGIQFAGVDGCKGTEQVVDGDLFDGETICNSPTEIFTWTEVYRRHWDTAAIYYGTALAIILVIGLIVMMMQRRTAPHTPFGEAQPVLSPKDSEHLR